MYLDCITIVLISLISSFIIESILYLFIYRHSNYIKLKDNIESLNNKVLKLKENIDIIKLKNNEKKISTLEDQIKYKNIEMSSYKFKSTIIVMIIMAGLFALLSSNYDTIIVAKLPFQPFSLLQNLTHRNIQGNDMTDCSFFFIV